MTPPRTLWPRLHLFELLDQEWYPAALRDHCTNYLATMSQRMGFFDPVAPLLLRGLEAGGTDTVLDLGSGGGGPLPRPGWEESWRRLPSSPPGREASSRE